MAEGPNKKSETVSSIKAIDIQTLLGSLCTIIPTKKAPKTWKNAGIAIMLPC